MTGGFRRKVKLINAVSVAGPEILWKKGIEENFLLNLFIYYYWKFKKLVIFHEIVRNIPASGCRWKMRYYESFLKILLTFRIFSNNIWISSEEEVLACPFFTVNCRRSVIQFLYTVRRIKRYCTLTVQCTLC
jgi:hypothetical protein